MYVYTYRFAYLRGKQSIKLTYMFVCIFQWFNCIMSYLLFSRGRSHFCFMHYSANSEMDCTSHAQAVGLCMTIHVLSEANSGQPSKGCLARLSWPFNHEMFLVQTIPLFELHNVNVCLDIVCLSRVVISISHTCYQLWTLFQAIGQLIYRK